MIKNSEVKTHTPWYIKLILPFVKTKFFIESREGECTILYFKKLKKKVYITETEVLSFDELKERNYGK